MLTYSHQLLFWGMPLGELDAYWGMEGILAN